MNGYDPDIVHRVHNELMEDINQRDIMIAELKSQTQELFEQNKEIVEMLEQTVRALDGNGSPRLRGQIEEVLNKYKKP